MPVSLNQPAQGAQDWHTPLNANFGTIEYELNRGDRLYGSFFCHEQSSPDMTVRVDAGILWSGGSLTEVAAQSTASVSAPSSNDRIDRVVLNPSDGSVEIVSGTESSTPSAPSIPSDRVPLCQFRLSTGEASINDDDITDERPASSFDSQMEDLRANLTATAKQINEGVFAAGDIKYRAVDDEPTGFLQCNGQAVSRTTYSTLFNEIGTTFGNGDGSSTFNVPDYRDRAVIGIATMGAGDAGRVDNYNTGLGQVGGEDQHQLSNAEMPSHNHGGSTGGAGSHSHGATYSGDNITWGNASQSGTRTFGGGVTGADTGNFEDYTTDSVGNHSHSISTNGSDNAHNNMMPFGTANILIKT